MIMLNVVMSMTTIEGKISKAKLQIFLEGRGGGWVGVVKCNLKTY